MAAKIVKSGPAPVASLNPYPGNARRGNIEVIKESLLRNGQYRPIVVQKGTELILAGNHTWAAARELGWDRLDATWVDCDEEEARRIVLVDNKSNDAAGYEKTALVELLADLGGDLEGTGFTKAELDKLLDSLEGPESKDPDTVPAAPSDPRTQEGDVWVLGPHRLLCGSALELGDLGLLMAGDEAALVVTSPPYNQKLDSFKPSGMQKENPRWVERMAAAYEDSLPEPEYQSEQLAVLSNLIEVTTHDASMFYNHKIRYRDKEILPPTDWLRTDDNPWKIRQEIIWDRCSSITLNAKMFMPQDERIYWLTKGEKFRFNDSADIKAYGTVWEIAPRVDVQVSAPFPVELPSRCIKACSGRGDIVLDPYGGSGTTLIACEQLGRRGFLLEVNPAYCDVIIERWESLTGEKATLEGT